MVASAQENFVIIDGNSLLYRAFYALPLLQNRRGEHTNAVYGFTNMLFKLIDEEKPDYLAVAFDPPKPTFRSRIDESYKAQREKAPPELGEQFQRVRKILQAMVIPVYEIEDFEADDVIGTLADLVKGKGSKVTIVSGDADLLQAVGAGVTVLLTKKGISRMERYDQKRLKEDYGLEPWQVIDYKALKGDSSDNIPGVPGIGEKTARRLIEEYGDLENIYQNIESLKKKTAANLLQYRDQLYTGRELVTLRRDVPLEINWQQCRYGNFDYDTLLNQFNELDFKSLANKLKSSHFEQNSGAAQESTNHRAVLVESPEQLKSILDNLESGADLALLFEREPGRPPWQQPVRLLTLALNENESYYLEPRFFKDREPEIWQSLAACKEKDLKILVHNLKQYYHLFAGNGFIFPGCAFDIELAAYLTDPPRGRYELTSLLQFYLGLEVEDGSNQKHAFQLEQRGPELAVRTGLLFTLRDLLKQELSEQGLTELLYDLEMPLAKVLSRMERQGITVDLEYLQSLSAEISRRLVELEEKIFNLAGEEFNLNSPQQLSKILFDKLQLPVIRKTKTGLSTDARVLEELAYQHEIAALLLHYRQLSKLQGTYLSGLIDLVDEDEKKLYTNFNQTVTATGRLSSSEPNLQNIPVRLEEGRRIRKAFIASGQGKTLFAADYSQVELRILAHLSQDPILVEAFKTGQDIHLRTASEVNNVPLEEVTPAMREKAKAVNFGIIYGSSDYGLAQNLKISRAEAKAYMDSYFDRYSGVKKYMAEIIEQARELGYVTTIYNRRRYLPEISSSNFNQRSFAERMALNTPIQGSAADIIKLAMLRIDSIISEGGFKAAMLLQIHDELLFEIDEDELNFFAPMVQREMEQACNLSVPLQVDLKLGANWEELKRF